MVRAETRALREAAGAGPLSEAVARSLAAGVTEVFLVATDHNAAGRSLRDLDLRRMTGATVLAVVRGETPNTNPHPDFVIEPGDSLVLVGAHQEIDSAFLYLERGETQPGGEPV